MKVTQLPDQAKCVVVTGADGFVQVVLRYCRIIAPYFHALVGEIRGYVQSLVLELQNNQHKMKLANREELELLFANYKAGLQKETLAVSHQLLRLDEQLAENKNALESTDKKVEELYSETLRTSDFEQRIEEMKEVWTELDGRLELQARSYGNDLAALGEKVEKIAVDSVSYADFTQHVENVRSEWAAFNERLENTVNNLAFTQHIENVRSEWAAINERLENTVNNSSFTQHIENVRSEWAAINERLGKTVQHSDYTQQIETLKIEWAVLNDKMYKIDEETKKILSLELRSTENEKEYMKLDNRMAQIASMAQEAAAYVSALHKEMLATYAGVTQRVDFLVRGVGLQAGDRVIVGQDDLVLVTTPLNSRFLVRQHDLIGREIVDGKEWEPHVRAEIERAAKSDGIAVDAGAYIGLHTVVMSQLFKKVYAFEPQPEVFRFLCANLTLNGCKNVASYNMALYDSQTSMRLSPQERQTTELIHMLDDQPDYDQLPNAAGLAFEPVDDAHGNVRAIPLDELRLENVAFIKIDTQGADLRVLQGAIDTIRRCRPIIAFEWEKVLGLQHGSSLEDFRTFFDDLNYELAILQETSPGNAADYIARPR